MVPENKKEWPDARYLRQGVKSNAWLLLNRVSIGFEIWRQLNGFPPTVPQEKEDGSTPNMLGPVKAS